MENDLKETTHNEYAPLVSICVNTYNHEKYIRQCLDGIFMQKVNSPYEVLVHDDASPDGTADIIREYEAKYPRVLKPIYQTENQYSKGGGRIARIQYERARGKYIAQCEGDDYWTDPGKLQMQVDFLEAHPEYVGTAHNVRVVDENGTDVPANINQYPIYEDHIFSLENTEYLRLSGQSASLVYKNIWLKLSSELKDDYYSCRGIGDRKLIVLLTLCGDMYCLSNVMSAYRYVTSSGTSWTARTRGKNHCDFVNYYYLDMMAFVNKWFSGHWDVKHLILYNLGASILRVVRNRTYSDVRILLNIIAEPYFFENIMKIIYLQPISTIKRMYKVSRLSKISATDL